MKNTHFLLLTAIPLFLLASCYKEYDNPVKPAEEEAPPPPVTSKYNSIEDFHAANEIKLQSFAFDAINGGSFMGQQGTEIIIPSSAFVTLAGDPVTGNVSIEFKEIYKKSDMILSAKPTIQSDGKPLKSAGEFFLKATSNGEAVKMAPGKGIVVKPNTFGLPADPDMEAFTAQSNPFSWVPANIAYVVDSTNSELFISQFLNPEDSGTWYNCDNGSLFAAYQQTWLNVQQNDDPKLYGTQVFLVFDDINTVVQIFNYSGNDFTYQFAPVGLSCLVVVVGVRDGVLYASMMPVTIEPNQTISFTMMPVSEEFLKGQLQLLD